MVPSQKNCCGYCRCTFTLKRDGKDGILWQSYAVLLWSTLQEQLWLGYKQLYSGTVQVHATWCMLCVEKSECDLFYQSILYFQLPIIHSVCPQIFHKPLFLNALGSSAYSQKHFTTIYFFCGGGGGGVGGGWVMRNCKVGNDIFSHTLSWLLNL